MKEDWWDSLREGGSCFGAFEAHFVTAAEVVVKVLEAEKEQKDQQIPKGHPGYLASNHLTYHTLCFGKMGKRVGLSLLSNADAAAAADG